MAEGTNVDGTAVLAKTDGAVLEALLREYGTFVLSRVEWAAGPVEGRGDIADIGMSAFYEAVLEYAPEKGAFLPFAALVIKRRVTDYLQGD